MLGFATAFAAIGTAAAQTTPQTTPSTNPPTQTAPVMTDAQFLDRAMASNLFEIEAGRLAQDKATDSQLKQFAAMMVTDHGKALAELEAISKELNRDVPDRLASQHQAKLNSLAAKDGEAFDIAYKAEMRVAHADTLALLQSQRPTARVDRVRAWIDRMMPVVQRHKTMIDSM